MLPYTPRHYLLFEGPNEILVMTSGNLADRPQITDDAEAAFRGVAEAILGHDRRIAVRVDDSVARPDGRTASPRRAAGTAVDPDVIALGAPLKATFCLERSHRLVLSGIGTVTSSTCTINAGRPGLGHLARCRRTLLRL